MDNLYVKLDDVGELIYLYEELIRCEDEHYSIIKGEISNKIKSIKFNAEEFWKVGEK